MSDSSRQIDVRIPTASSHYPVMIGRGILSSLGPHVRRLRDPSRATVVSDANVAESLGRMAVESLQSANVDADLLTLETSETAKSLATVRYLYDHLLRRRLDRASIVVGVGGGVISDTVGFAAATYLRGIAFTIVPTTLLAMVDASVGGKTGVNIELPDGYGLGKNLVGAFEQPMLVLMDLAALDTLPERNLRAGLGECVKHALLGDAEMFAMLEHAGPELRTWDVGDLADFVARNVNVKVAIVEADERESRRRMLLNLGHTFAHALETTHGLDLWHGEAVALGLIAAAAAGQRIGRTPPGLADRLRALNDHLGLPIRLRTAPNPDDLAHRMSRDKKAGDGRLRLVVPTEIGRAEIIDDAPPEAVMAGWLAIGASPSET